jgi:hypothetical protein
VTIQQELAEARLATTRATEAEALKERQLETLKDREIDAIRRQLNSSEATAREAHSRIQVQMEVQRKFMLPLTNTPAYSSSNMYNPSAFLQLTPASGMSTQELRVPTAYSWTAHRSTRAIIWDQRAGGYVRELRGQTSSPAERIR